MKYEITVSPSVFRDPYVLGHTRWFVVAWVIGQWFVFRHPHAAIFINPHPRTRKGRGLRR